MKFIKNNSTLNDLSYLIMAVMTCGMLLRGWIEWGVDIKSPAYVSNQGLGKEKYCCYLEIDL